MQCVVHLDELVQLQKAVKCTRVSHEVLVLRREEVQLDAQLLHVAPGAAREQVLEEAELGALRVHRHEVQRSLQVHHTGTHLYLTIVLYALVLVHIYGYETTALTLHLLHLNLHVN